MLYSNGAFVVDRPFIDVRLAECATGDNGSMRHRNIAHIHSRNSYLSPEQVTHCIVCRAMGEERDEAGGDPAVVPARRTVERMFTL
jgi:hypothetical protein